MSTKFRRKDVAYEELDETFRSSDIHIILFSLLQSEQWQTASTIIYYPATFYSYFCLCSSICILVCVVMCDWVGPTQV